MEDCLHIELVNQLTELDTLDQKMDQFCKQTGLDTKVTFQLKLILEELITNIISYGYEDEKEHEIVLHVHRKEKEISITIIDDGKPFNPVDSEPPDTSLSVDERAIGGLGIHFVKSYIDLIQYQRINNENRLTMIKNLYS